MKKMVKITAICGIIGFWIGRIAGEVSRYISEFGWAMYYNGLASGLDVSRKASNYRFVADQYADKAAARIPVIAGLAVVFIMAIIGTIIYKKFIKVKIEKFSKEIIKNGICVHY